MAKRIDMKLDKDAAVAAGLLVKEAAEVIVPAKYSPNGQELRAYYDRYQIAEGLDPESIVRAALALTGDAAKVTKLINTQHNLLTTQPIRHRLVNAAKKPTAARRKIALNMVKAGLASNVDEAMAALDAMAQNKVQ